MPSVPDSSGGPPCRWGESVCPPGDMSSHLKTLLIAALSGWVLLWYLRGKVQECGYTSFDARESTLTAPPPRALSSPPRPLHRGGETSPWCEHTSVLPALQGPCGSACPGWGARCFPLASSCPCTVAPLRKFFFPPREEAPFRAFDVWMAV